MGLITLLFLLAFTALYLGKSLNRKPDLLVIAVAAIESRLDKIALWGASYGAVAFLLTLLIRYGSIDMLIRLIANALVVLMALPFIFEKLVAKYEEKVNPAIMTETRNFVGWITQREKIVGYVSAAASVLLFVILFR